MKQSTCFSESSGYCTPAALKWVGMVVLALIELLVVSIRFDSGVLVESQGILRVIAERLPAIPQFAGVVLAATLVFGSKELTACLVQSEHRTRSLYSVPLFLLLHVAVFSIFLLASTYYFEVDCGASIWVFMVWSVLALATVASWLALAVEPHAWFAIGKQLWLPILIGLCVGSLAWFAGEWAKEAWELLAFQTFQLVWVILKLFFVNVEIDTTILAIGTGSFAVCIAPECSGYEGMGLAIVFMATYLWWKRAEHLFPRSFILIPVSVCLMFVVNAIRIAMLILIGHCGFEQVALGGFHSQAGWIGFNLVALGLVAFARTSPLFCNAKVRNETFKDLPTDNQSVPMLAPFVFLTVSIMLLGIVQSGFDWLYPVRFLVVATVVAFLFRRYPHDYWKLELQWTPVVIGICVYAMWVLLEKGDHGSNALFETARSSSPIFFWIWLGFRILGSVITVPLAEEFAFRGYLLPWLASSRTPRFSLVALVVSSVAFGVLHPGRWLAGTIAGCLYGIAFYQRGKVMDAVIAHATTNAIIAVEAVVFSRWYLWG